MYNGVCIAPLAQIVLDASLSCTPAVVKKAPCCDHKKSTLMTVTSLQNWYMQHMGVLYKGVAIRILYL